MFHQHHSGTFFVTAKAGSIPKEKRTIVPGEGEKAGLNTDFGHYLFR